MAHTLIISASGNHSEISSEIPVNLCDRDVVIGLLQFSGLAASNPRYVDIHTDLTYGFYRNGEQDNTISHITNLTGGLVNINYEPAHIKWCSTFAGLAGRRRVRFWFTDEDGASIEIGDPDLTIQLTYV